MSYDLERAVERAIERLRGTAKARRRDGDDYLADNLDELANSLDRPLDAINRARAREEERRKAERLR